MDEESKSPFNVWWYAAAGFLVLVLVAAVMLGMRIGRGSGEDEPEAQPTVQEPSAGSPEGPAAEEDQRACGELSMNQDYPQEAPEAEWVTYGSSSLTVPVSQEYGPLDRDGDLWGCYAHSPTGAVYAGLGLIASFSVGGQYEAAIDTPQAEAAFENEQGAGTESFPAFSGFRIDEYTDDSARISYYGKQSPHVAAVSFSLLWDDEAQDWRLDWTRPDGFEENPDESGFVMWER